MKKLVFLCILIWPIITLAASPDAIHFGYMEQDYCTNTYCPDSDCDGSVGDPNYGDAINAWGGCWYLYATADSTDLSSNTQIGGGAEYIIDSTPTFYFNAEDDTNSSIYFDFDLDNNSDFSSPIVAECSSAVTLSDGNDSGSADWSYTVGSALGTYGSSTSYYWRVRACTNADCSTECTAFLVSGGDPADTTCDATDYGFKLASYTINPNDADDYYTSVGGVTASQAKIAFATPHSVDYYVRYGTDSTLVSGTNTTEVEVTTGALIETITGLSEDTQYYYRLYVSAANGSPSAISPIRSFRTARSEGQPFRFVITADQHTATRSEYLTTSDTAYEYAIPEIQNVIEDLGADFWVDMGDWQEADMQIYWTQDHADGLYACSMRGINYIAHSLPIVSVVGNHENINQYYGTHSDTTFQARCTKNATYDFWKMLGVAREKFMPQHIASSVPADYYNTYYSFDWGDARFIILDPYTYTTSYPEICSNGFTLGTTQQAWFEGQVSGNTKIWTLIFIHQTGGVASGVDYTDTSAITIDECYGRGGATTLQNTSLWTEIYKGVRHRRNIVLFHGHDHVFAHSEKDGLNVIGCPGVGMFANDWPYDESFGLHGEDWIYEADEDWQAEIDTGGINTGTGVITFTNKTGGATPVSGWWLRNVTGSYMRKVTAYSAGSSTITVQTSATDDGVSTQYVYPLSDWSDGDVIAFHKPKKGHLTVDISTSEIKVSMIDNEDGSAVVVPPLYSWNTTNVEVIIPAPTYQQGASYGIGGAHIQ